MGFLRNAILLAACSLCWHLTAGVVAAQPPSPPHAFFGEVTVDGQAAPTGTVIESRAEGILVDIPGNPITTTVAGRYGGPLLQEAKLVVQGKVVDALALEFYINGARAQCAPPGGVWQDTYPFQAGGVTALNLRIGSGQGAAGAPPPTVLEELTPVPEQAQPTAKPEQQESGDEAAYRTATPQTPHPEPATPAPAMTPTPSARATQPAASPLPDAAAGSPAREEARQAQTATRPSPLSTTAPKMTAAEIAEPTPVSQSETPAQALPLPKAPTSPTAQAIAAVLQPTSTPLLQAGRAVAVRFTPVAPVAGQRDGLRYLPVVAIGSLFSAVVIAVATLVLRKTRIGI